jgi:outer membrane protein
LSIGAAAVLLLVCFTGRALCQEKRIGILDMARIIDHSKQGKKAMEEMADSLKRAQKDLDKLQADLVKMKDEIEKDAMILPAEELAEKEREYQNKLIEYQRTREQYQDQLTVKSEEINTAMLTLVEDIVTEIGEDGYLLIIEMTSSGVLYAADGVDLTDEVIERLNRR